MNKCNPCNPGRVHGNAAVAVRLLLAAVPQEGGAHEPHGGAPERPPARLQPVRRALRAQVRPHGAPQGARLRAGPRAR